MKPYFTKYLPVEGEIKEGDKLNSLNGEIPGSQHVRLFLCSRDIQVEDEIYIPSLNEYHKFLKADNHSLVCETLNGQHDETFDLCDYFKVIGEVSPEAIWVTEGMEFEESEIEINYKHRTDSRPLKDSSWEFLGEGEDNEGKYYDYRKLVNVKIKCSACKTFH